MLRDAGVIKCFKGYYRSNHCDRILYLMAEEEDLNAHELTKNISVLDAIHMSGMISVYVSHADWIV